MERDVSVRGVESNIEAVAGQDFERTLRVLRPDGTQVDLLNEVALVYGGIYQDGEPFQPFSRTYADGEVTFGLPATHTLARSGVEGLRYAFFRQEGGSLDDYLFYVEGSIRFRPPGSRRRSGFRVDEPNTITVTVNDPMIPDAVI